MCAAAASIIINYWLNGIVREVARLTSSGGGGGGGGRSVNAGTR